MSAGKPIYVKPGDLTSTLSGYLRRPNEKDRVFPKNKKIEVVFLVEAVNAILPRTEGVEDITLIKLPGTEYEVPVILPEKLQAVSRRRMLAQLRKFRDARPDRLGEYLKTLASLFTYKSGRGQKQAEVKVGFSRAREYAKNPGAWNCYVQPPGGDVKEATDVGMDGFCPACALFGSVIDGSKIDGLGNESIGVKSRVEFDPAIAFLDQEKSTASYTHNKVSDGVSWTGQSLYEEKHVMPGTVFIGKVTLEDVTNAELKAFLAVLAGLDRIGGRERLFGGIRVHLVGVRGGSYESVSALEIARHLAEQLGGMEYPPSVGTVEEKVREYLLEKGFYHVKSSDYRPILDDMSAWDELWSHTVEYDRQIIERVLQLVKGAGKFEQA